MRADSVTLMTMLSPERIIIFPVAKTINPDTINIFALLRSGRPEFRTKKSKKYTKTRTQNPGLKTKTGYNTYITNSQNTKRTYGQPSEQLFPKRWPLIRPDQRPGQNPSCHLSFITVH